MRMYKQSNLKPYIKKKQHVWEFIKPWVIVQLSLLMTRLLCSVYRIFKIYCKSKSNAHFSVFPAEPTFFLLLDVP